MPFMTGDDDMVAFTRWGRCIPRRLEERIVGL